MSELSRRIAALSPDKRALLEKRLRRSPSPNEGQRIAVIGAGCRLPGAVDSLDSFWTMLEAGVDAITEVPNERWCSLLMEVTTATSGRIILAYPII